MFHRVECLELDLLMLYILERERLRGDREGQGEEGCEREVEYRYNQVESESLYFYIMYAFTFRIHD